MELRDRLIISKPLYISEPANPRCGYCKGMKDPYKLFAVDSWYQRHGEEAEEMQINSVTIGLQAELLPVEIYDELCNFGFRRSGNFLYKADMLRNCCRLYTIKTEASQLKLSKELRACIKKFVKKVTKSSCVDPRSSPHTEEAPTQSAQGNHGSTRFPFINTLIDAECASEEFYTRFEPPLFTQEKYDLFVKYQEKVHGDYTSQPNKFKRFLCESPFPDEVVLGNAQEWAELNNWRTAKVGQTFQRVGPAHECYYYQGKLIALAVSDFLPSGISSVYFIWDPDYSKWSLGKVSALREIAMTTKINRNYYYLGYYIEDCPKMKYKAMYGGELLDVCNNQYIPLQKLEPFIANGKFFVLDNIKSNGKPERLCEDEVGNCDRIGELPLDEKAPVDMDRPVMNIADYVYGVNGGATQLANEAIDQLRDLGIDYTPQVVNEIYERKVLEDNSIPEYVDNIYNLPNVVPGLLPLWQLLQLIKCGEINQLNGKMMLYNTHTGHLRLLKDFHRETNVTKRAICNVIRLIGLRNTSRSLIII